MQLIYHSDDMGATPSTSSRIMRAWEEGLIEGFSIFANGKIDHGVKVHIIKLIPR